MTDHWHLVTKNIDYLKRRAQGGAASVCLGDVQVDVTGDISWNPKVRAWDKENEPGFYDMAGAIRSQGAHASMELVHAGMHFHEADRINYGPSDMIDEFDQGDGYGIRRHKIIAMPREIIDQVVDSYGKAALRAKHCGFTSVLLHAGHGWLPAQFLSPVLNHREDEFGGSLENRARFTMMVVSMGMQTAVEDELRLLGRIHSIDDAKTSVERAKSAGFNNISLDLMMGIPNQTIESLEKSISFCADCKVTHISSYILKIEENTPFYKVQNKLKLADDDMQAEMYLKAVEMLDSLGYKQYEISNFAKQGYESRHNTNYWRCGEYIGIGPSAHSFFDGKRFFYSRSMDDFNNNKLSFEGTGGDEEEFIMLSLRLKSGLNYSEFEEKFGYTLPSYIIEKAKEYEKYGYTNVTDKSISFTPKGFLVSNSIISELI